MEMKNWAMTLGLGVAVGALSAMMLPRESAAKKALHRAADTVEDTIEDTAKMISRKWDM